MHKGSRDILSVFTKGQRAIPEGFLPFKPSNSRLHCFLSSTFYLCPHTHLLFPTMFQQLPFSLAIVVHLVH